MTQLPRRAFPALVSGRQGNSTGPLTPADDWSRSLPVLPGRLVSLRELAATDAVALHALLNTASVDRLISPPPPDADAFERFIATMRQGRESGACACFGLVPAGAAAAVGLIQIRQLEPGFRTAEWGFALGAPYWGRGLFSEAAQLALDFAFGVLRIHRLEARVAVGNGRGNGAMRKVGAVQEGILRRSFFRDGEYMDQVLWTILAADRARTKTPAALIH